MGKQVVTFGEIMMRLSPADHLRFSQARSFVVTYGGSEANVAVSLANYGAAVEFVTCLPENALGFACVQFLREYGVGVEHVMWSGQRLGIYFLEVGAAQRGSQVIYDRAQSAIATIEPGIIRWEQALANADWFHWSGITPAISAGAAATCSEAVQRAKQMGLTVSADLNYRKNLWKWGQDPHEIMPGLLTQCDMVVANEEDADKVLGIQAPGADVTKGQVDPEQYLPVCREMVARFPNLRTIAVTLRGSVSASHNTWSGVLWHQGTFHIGPEYHLTTIVDRVGAGDAFAGGLIYSLRASPEDPQQALDFALAASCLKHSIFGDFNLATAAEVRKLMGGDSSGRVSR
jgi:2-dehydro-3-deoxygluconokinase